MKYLFFGSIPIILLSSMAMPTAEALEIQPASIQDLDEITTLALSGRIRDEFFDGLDNRLSDRYHEEYFEDLLKG